MQLEEHKHIRFVWLPIFANLKYTWFRDMFTFLELGKSLLWILYLILKLVPCMFPKVNRDSYGTLPIETDDLANYSTGWFPSSQTVIIYSHYIVIICHYVYNCIYIYMICICYFQRVQKLSQTIFRYQSNGAVLSLWGLDAAPRSMRERCGAYRMFIAARPAHPMVDQGSSLKNAQRLGTF